MAKCLICDKELVMNAGHAPDGGTMWQTMGNYGSTVYDDSRILIACVCDPCLLLKQNSIIQRFLHVKHSHLDIPWKPGG